jgi:hypothetical protein
MLGNLAMELVAGPWGLGCAGQLTKCPSGSFRFSIPDAPPAGGLLPHQEQLGESILAGSEAQQWVTGALVLESLTNVYQGEGTSV